MLKRRLAVGLKDLNMLTKYLLGKKSHVGVGIEFGIFRKSYLMGVYNA